MKVMKLHKLYTIHNIIIHRMHTTYTNTHNIFFKMNGTVHIFNNITLIMLCNILLFSFLHFSYGGILSTFHVVGFCLVGFCPWGFCPVFFIL